MYSRGGIKQPSVELWTEGCPSGLSCLLSKWLGLYPYQAQSIHWIRAAPGGWTPARRLSTTEADPEGVAGDVCRLYSLQQALPGRGALATHLHVYCAAHGTVKDGTGLKYFSQSTYLEYLNFTNKSPFLIFIVPINNVLI